MTSETEPSVSDRDDIFAMLSASGYHRARVKCLSEFDRIVGGIAWALVRYDDVSVAVNLLYEETEDQNIKLRTEQSEKIVEALQAVKCPFEISAHQLLGLDYTCLKNVVQWLLRHVVAQNKKEGKYEFFMQWFTMGHSSEKEAIAEYKKRLRRPNSNRLATTRRMKRFDNSIIFDLSMDAKCTLAEYVTYSRTGERLYPTEEEEPAVEESSNLQEASSQKHVPTSTVRDMMEIAVVEVFKDESPELMQVCTGIFNMIDEYNIPEMLSVMENRVADEAVAYRKAHAHLEVLQKKYDQVVSTFNTVDQMDVDQMNQIIKMFQGVQARAQELRICAVEDMESYRKKELILRQNMDKHGNVLPYDVHRREIIDKHAEKTSRFADSVRDVLALQFRLDRILGVTLSSHYRKRNMERSGDSSEINQEMKATVIDHNITCDILRFSARITGFMNQVENSLLAEPASQEYRDAFVSYMNDVRTQLEEYHWKAKLTQDNTITEKQTLAALRATIRNKEREVNYTSMEMKKLLFMNKNLQNVADSLTEIENQSEAYARKKGIVREPQE